MRAATTGATTAIVLLVAPPSNEPASLRSLAWPRYGPKRAVTALFTSGSTGLPKPRWFADQNWVDRNPRAASGRPFASCAPVFQPLSHGLARRQVWREISHGGRIGMVDTTDELIRQIGLFEPSGVTAIPSFFVLLQDRFRAHLAAAAAAAGRAPDEPPTEAEGAAAYKAVNALFGPRVMHIAVGGAIVPKPLLEFLTEAFGIGGLGGGNAAVMDGYGARRAAAAAPWAPRPRPRLRRTAGPRPRRRRGGAQSGGRRRAVRRGHVARGRGAPD